MRYKQSLNQIGIETEAATLLLARLKQLDGDIHPSLEGELANATESLSIAILKLRSVTEMAELMPNPSSAIEPTSSTSEGS